MTTQYDVIPFLQWYETHTMLRNGMKCIPVKDTHFLKQIVFLKSLNSLLSLVGWVQNVCNNIEGS